MSLAESGVFPRPDALARHIHRVDAFIPENVDRNGTFIFLPARQAERGAVLTRLILPRGTMDFIYYPESPQAYPDVFHMLNFHELKEDPEKNRPAVAPHAFIQHKFKDRSDRSHDLHTRNEPFYMHAYGSPVAKVEYESVTQEVTVTFSNPRFALGLRLRETNRLLLNLSIANINTSVWIRDFSNYHRPRAEMYIDDETYRYEVNSQEQYLSWPGVLSLTYLMPPV